MSTLQTVQQLLIEEYGLAPDKVCPEARFHELGIDSLQTIEFMFLLEDKFNLHVSADPGVVKTVAEIAQQIDGLIARQQASAQPGKKNGSQ